MKITDQSQSAEVVCTFVEDDDGHFYLHWLSLQHGNAMVFVVASDMPICERIHKLVAGSLGVDSNSNLGVPARGASFTVN